MLKDSLQNKNTYWILGIVAALILLGIILVAMPGRETPPARRPLDPEVSEIKEEPTISVFRHATGKTEHMPLEKYLEGVVAAEIGPKFPAEALKAQAIVARSMTMAKIVRGGVKNVHNTDTCDLPEHFQAYDLEKVTPEISKAVQDTRGQVLLHKGKFAYLLFHSYAGPKTADLRESFPELVEIADSYIKVVDSPGAKYAPDDVKQWEASIPRGELQNIFGAGADLSAIKITKKGPSGRAIDITAGKSAVKGYDLRSRLGAQRLKSTLISSIAVQGNNVVFTGQGWGHGCGMAQWGAYAMAEDGKTARQIVSYYFPNTDFHKAWK
ncbi:MAG: SpoIID/LytB domain-containing protein [Syntrophomonadaceae bacterium]|nr:SpoIID/LytB domain-containing protein [Syntrophomonadaceae bacterium]